MNRILCIVGSMNTGGAETFLMKIFRKLDRTKYQMDFCVSSDKEGYYDKEILAGGGKIFHTTPKTQGSVKSFLSLRKIVKDNNYKYVMRVSQHSLSCVELVAAKCGGAKRVVFRSSNSGTGGGKVNRFLHKVFAFLPKYVPDVRIAPSTEAAEFMFGKNSVKKGKAELLHNAIEVDNYTYNTQKRESLRKELNLEGKFVIGHIGRFMQQKNHKFLIDIFYEISKKCDNAHLVLVGTGHLEAEIKEKVETLKLEDKVTFLGVRSDVPDLLSAFDVKLFPSLYEGMPNTIIEAQASGLHCVISDTITPEADITGLVDYLPLNLSPSKWAEKVLEYKNYERKNMKEEFLKQGYDIKSITEKFVQLIFD